MPRTTRIARDPTTSTACAKCYGNVTTAAGSGDGTQRSFTRTSTSSATIRPTGTEQFDAISHLLIDGARRVTAPTLLVRGLLSDVVSQATVEEFTQLVPHAETVDVSGTGHMIAGDDNDAFTAAVTDFLGRCTP